MKEFTVKLINFENPKDTKTVTIEAENAVFACCTAEKRNSGYLGVSSDIVED